MSFFPLLGRGETPTHLVRVSGHKPRLVKPGFPSYCWSVHRFLVVIPTVTTLTRTQNPPFVVYSVTSPESECQTPIPLIFIFVTHLLCLLSRYTAKLTVIVSLGGPKHFTDVCKDLGYPGSRFLWIPCPGSIYD